MKIRIEVEEGECIVASAECDAAAEDSLESVVSRLATQLELEPEDILLDLDTNGHRFERRAKISDCIRHGDRWRHRRTCVELHFESEEATHRFPAAATWGRVHKWACEHFHVPKELCVNLELREGSPTGPALNEKREIGVRPACQVVWLVKPGPEPNGNSR